MIYAKNLSLRNTNPTSEQSTRTTLALIHTATEEAMPSTAETPGISPISTVTSNRPTAGRIARHMSACLIFSFPLIAVYTNVES